MISPRGLLQRRSGTGTPETNGKLVHLTTMQFENIKKKGGGYDAFTPSVCYAPPSS